MILALLASSALAQELTEADRLRLLGPPPEPTTAPAAPAAGPPPVAAPAAPEAVAPASSFGGLGLGFPLAGLAAGAGLLWLGRKQQLLTPVQKVEEMRVVGRAQLSRDAMVTLLEVRDAGGQWRRLLVGTGAQGPQLLTGLGTEALQDLPEVPAFAVRPPAPRRVEPPAPTAPAAATPRPVARRSAPVDVPPLPAELPPAPTPPAVHRGAPVARGGAPARSYAEVAAAWESFDDAPAGPTLERPQTRAGTAPARSAREVLAMIEEVRRGREAG